MSPTVPSEETLLELSAVEQARRLNTGELNAVTLTDLYLRRIAEHAERIYPFVTTLPRRARRQAARYRPSENSSPLAGIPTGVKDADPLRFAFTRVGSRSYKWVWPPYDGPTVKRMRAAGMVFIGKTTTSEFTLLPVVEPDIHPPTRNPWSTEHTAGGSSGGAAAAVAARLLPIAQGSDGGGSIRIPASCCHLFGLKVSRYLLPNFYGSMDPLLMTGVGALARGVEDAAAFLDILRGDGKDAMQRLAAEPPEEKLRARLCTSTPLCATDPEILAATQKIASLLEGMGYSFEEIDGVEVALDEFLPIYQRLAANPPVIRESILQPATRYLRDPGRKLKLTDVAVLFRKLGDFVVDWFGDVDLMVTPTLPIPPLKVGALDDLPGAEQFREAANMGAFTAGFNVSGQPAATIPVGFNRDGLPIGVQLVAPHGQDGRLLRIAAHLQKELRWQEKRPPGF